MTDSNRLPAPRPDWALFLDVDGTLVEIAETPHSVRPDPDLPDILSDLKTALGGAVALVSGRPLNVLDGFFAPLVLPAAGLHGLERRRADGHITRPVTPPAAMTAAREAMKEFANGQSGLLIEDKDLTIALHYRKAPALEKAVTAFAESLIARLDEGLVLQRGKMVVEIRPSGPDKGTVIESFMAEAPFIGRIPVFAGDDVTDENGFAAVNRLGGHSIRVGNGPSLAKKRMANVKELISWLRQLNERLSEPAGGGNPASPAEGSDEAS